MISARSLLALDDLHEATSGAAVDASELVDGWTILLDRPGEKVLARSTTLVDHILFTSYLPDASINACHPGFAELTTRTW